MAQPPLQMIEQNHDVFVCLVRLSKYELRTVLGRRRGINCHKKKKTNQHQVEQLMILRYLGSSHRKVILAAEFFAVDRVTHGDP